MATETQGSLVSLRPYRIAAILYLLGAILAVTSLGVRHSAVPALAILLAAISFDTIRILNEVILREHVHYAQCLAPDTVRLWPSDGSMIQEGKWGAGPTMLLAPFRTAKGAWKPYLVAIAVLVAAYLSKGRGEGKIWAAEPLGLVMVAVALDKLAKLRAQAAFQRAWCLHPANPFEVMEQPPDQGTRMWGPIQNAYRVAVASALLAVPLAVFQGKPSGLLAAVALGWMAQRGVEITFGLRDDLLALGDSLAQMGEVVLAKQEGRS